MFPIIPKYFRVLSFTYTLGWSLITPLPPLLLLYLFSSNYGVGSLDGCFVVNHHLSAINLQHSASGLILPKAS